MKHVSMEVKFFQGEGYVQGGMYNSGGKNGSSIPVKLI